MKEKIKDYTITLLNGEEEHWEDGSLGDIKNYIEDNKILEEDIDQIYIKHWILVDGNYQEDDVEMISFDELNIEYPCESCYDGVMHRKMVDLDGTNLEEFWVCNKCDFKKENL